MLIQDCSMSVLSQKISENPLQSKARVLKCTKLIEQNQVTTVFIVNNHLLKTVNQYLCANKRVAWKTLQKSEPPFTMEGWKVFSIPFLFSVDNFI